MQWKGDRQTRDTTNGLLQMECHPWMPRALRVAGDEAATLTAHCRPLKRRLEKPIALGTYQNPNRQGMLTMIPVPRTTGSAVYAETGVWSGVLPTTPSHSLLNYGGGHRERTGNRAKVAECSSASCVWMCAYLSACERCLFALVKR
jgi:hypothetical protein